MRLTYYFIGMFSDGKHETKTILIKGAQYDSRI